MSKTHSKLDSLILAPRPALSSVSFMISYADLMTILAVFFVMLLSMSDLRKGTFDTLRSQFTGKSEGTLVDLSNKLNELTRIVGPDAGVSIYVAEDGVRMDLDSAALFETGEAVLRDQSLEKLTPVLKHILRTSYSIDIEGHTDDRGLYRKDGDEIETNWSLSGRRSSSVALYLMDFGFSEKRLRIVGYAATKPKVKTEGLANGALEEARARNRRVTLLVR